MKRALFLSAIMICFGSFVFADPYFSIDGRTVFFLAEQQTYNGVTSDVTQGWGGRDWASGGPQIDVGCGWIDKKMEYHLKIRLLNNLVDKDNDIIVNEAFAVAKIVPDFFRSVSGIGRIMMNSEKIRPSRRISSASITARQTQAA